MTSASRRAETHVGNQRGTLLCYLGGFDAEVRHLLRQTPGRRHSGIGIPVFFWKPKCTDHRLSGVVDTALQAVTMSHGFKSVAMVLLLPGLCLTQSLTSADALDRDLARSRDRRQECSGLVFAVQIEDSLPKLRKQGSVSGLKLVSQTGQIVCRGLEFTGDSIVKTALIARFLAHDVEPPEASGDASVTLRKPFHVQPQSFVLLRRFPRHPVGFEAGANGFRGTTGGFED